MSIFGKTLAIAITTAAASCATTPYSSLSSWEQSFQCANGILEAGIKGPYIEKVSSTCIVVEKKGQLFFYTPIGVSRKLANEVFSDEEDFHCRNQYLKKEVVSNFDGNEDKYKMLLFLQFPNNELKPLKFTHALVAYKKTFRDNLKNCLNQSNEVQLKKFKSNLEKISKHAEFLSSKRNFYSETVKGRVSLKSMKRTDRNEWEITLKTNIVNNDKASFQFSSTCDTSSSYFTTTPNVRILENPCENHNYNLNNIAPNGVFRDEISAIIESTTRPGGKEVEIFFGAVPSIYLGKVKIPEK